MARKKYKPEQIVAELNPGVTGQDGCGSAPIYRRDELGSPWKRLLREL